jgi:hypothetical protein
VLQNGSVAEQESGAEAMIDFATRSDAAPHPVNSANVASITAASAQAVAKSNPRQVISSSLCHRGSTTKKNEQHL